MSDNRRILVYWGSPEGPMAWDVSSPDSRDQSYLELFRLLADVGDMPEAPDEVRQLYDMARRGNPKYARAFLSIWMSELGRASKYQEMGLRTFEGRPTVRVECPGALEEDDVPKGGTDR